MFEKTAQKSKVKKYKIVFTMQYNTYLSLSKHIDLGTYFWFLVIPANLCIATQPQVTLKKKSHL